MSNIGYDMIDTDIGDTTAAGKTALAKLNPTFALAIKTTLQRGRSKPEEDWGARLAESRDWLMSLDASNDPDHGLHLDEAA